MLRVSQTRRKHVHQTKMNNLFRRRYTYFSEIRDNLSSYAKTRNSALCLSSVILKKSRSVLIIPSFSEFGLPEALNASNTPE